MTRYLLSFDIEDWFHAANLRPAISPDEWEDCELRVERNTRCLLDLLEKADVVATFFVLGWVAERVPDLVREIDRRGHEVASHGYRHELVTGQSESEFRTDVRASQDIIDPLIDGSITGYRAPSFSITEWAVDVLDELGFRYDSSLVPGSFNARYGSLRQQATREPFRTDCGLHEIPLPTLDVGLTEIPWGGGGYFRVLPYEIYRRGVRRIAEETGTFVFYLHPWELDPAQPKIDEIPRSYRFRHYTNLDRTKPRLRRLLESFDWEPIGRTLDVNTGGESQA